MAALRRVLYLGASLGVCVWLSAAAENNEAPSVENIQWTSLDFKTVLTWTSKPSKYTYSVLYSSGDSDWLECPDCTQVSAAECDMTTYLIPPDRSYTADVKIESDEDDDDLDLDQLPHNNSPPFNPYRESNISAVKFSVTAVDESRVTVNVSDTLTSIYRDGKPLSIRDVLRNQLKYKISYYKSGSTGKRDVISDSSVAEVSDLDPGLSYCFMVAAFIPSRPKNQYGAWSRQQCTHGHEHGPRGVNVGALVGGVFSLVALVIIIVTVVFLCCRSQSKNLHTSQSSQAV